MRTFRGRFDKIKARGRKQLGLKEGLVIRYIVGLFPFNAYSILLLRAWFSCLCLDKAGGGAHPKVPSYARES